MLQAFYDGDGDKGKVVNDFKIKTGPPTLMHAGQYTGQIKNESEFMSLVYIFASYLLPEGHHNKRDAYNRKMCNGSS